MENIFSGIDSIFRIQTSHQTPKGKRQWLRRMARKLEQRATAYAHQGCFREADDLDGEATCYYQAADEIEGRF